PCHIVISMAWLKLLTEAHAGERVPLNKDKTIFGRHQTCDYRLAGKTVSREHFAIERNNGKVFVVDLESVNGTFANGERVSWVELKHGDTIKAGSYVLVFEESAESDPTEESTSEDQSSSPSKTSGGTQQSFSAAHERLFPREYLEGIEHFNARRYFDAHEVWEEIWLRSSGQTKLFYQMLIQAAVGLHHYERGNIRGASGMFKNVIGKLERLPGTYMSIDLIEFARQFKSYFAGLDENEEAADRAEKPRPVIDLLEVDADTGEQRIEWE
ncbi:MAG TPA: DUF309 domain-containing protein, partial [Blastocatellia bacterium]|nr:DUF309 domain-containing protein [Blastocatellia bacterium]